MASANGANRDPSKKRRRSHSPEHNPPPLRLNSERAQHRISVSSLVNDDDSQPGGFGFGNSQSPRTPNQDSGQHSNTQSAPPSPIPNLPQRPTTASPPPSSPIRLPSASNNHSGRPPSRA